MGDGDDDPAALRDIIERAAVIAREIRHGYVGSEHLLLALLGSTGTRAAHRLEAAGARCDEVRARIARILGAGEEEIAETELLPWTTHALDVVIRVRKDAERAKPEPIGTEHILRGLLRVRESVAVRALEDSGVDTRALADELRRARPDDE